MGCDSIKWRCLRGLSSVLKNLPVHRYNIQTTDRHRHWGLGTEWHRRLRANVLRVCCRLLQCLANVDRRLRHKALAAKVSVGHIQAMDTVGDVNSPAGDVISHPSADTVRRRRRWAEACSPTGLHVSVARRGVTSWNIHRRSLQQTAEACSGCWSQHWRWSAASV